MGRLLRRISIVFMMISVVFTGGAFAASLETMVGQMILIGFQGKSVEAVGVRAVRDDIAAGRIGGVMYLRTNVASLSAVNAMNDMFGDAHDIAPLIALDQEGGSIERLTNAVGFEEIPSAQHIAANYDVNQAKNIYARMARGVADLGFTINFGPVVDLNLNPNNPIIARYGRSFSADAQVVASYAGAFIDAHHGAGVLTALKHFPGHGSSRADSHEGFVDISEYWQPVELEPYQRLIQQNRIDVVMMAHLYHRQYAGENGGQTPASLSKVWINDILRRQLGYDGVVISDDMEMGAIRSHYTLAQSVILAVEAGTDILLFSNTANYRTSLAREIGEILMAEARSNSAFRARIEQSYARIMQLKGRL